MATNRERTDFIAIHCAATPPSMDIGVPEIRNWHLAKGWRDIGYHYVIRRTGEVEVGRNLREPGAHVQGFNNVSVGICLVGGVDEDNEPEQNFTARQYDALLGLALQLKNTWPEAAVWGHRDFPNVDKACPSFDVRTWWRCAAVKHGWLTYE